MGQTVRALIASPLGHHVEERFARLLAPASVEVAADGDEVRRAVEGRVRFDVVLSDLTWRRPGADGCEPFDGLALLDLLAELDRAAPVVYAVQGAWLEQDFVDEAVGRAETAALVRKTDTVDGMGAVVRAVAAGERHALPVPARRPLASWLGDGRRGETAARMAGAIASGRASDTRSLARAASVSVSTAEKLASYVGPMMLERGEHDPALRLTSASVYRWCALHAVFLVSWCRRHGLADVLGEGVARPGATAG
ncbi:MAG: response regulator [Nocardioides sp.]|nr:response regulator [Nocardioides sp.]